MSNGFLGRKLPMKLLKFIMKYFHKIILLFFVWRLLLFLIAYLSPFFIPNFGGRFPYYQSLLISTHLPYWIWGFANFDGVHYITIAQHGYIAQYTQAFFPFYPILIHLLNLFESPLLTGLVLSNFFFFLALFFLYKLFLDDYSPTDSFKALILLVSFPTAFYFGA